MGLCKCPKRRVTNQFCFEHRVNVCEHCMVSNHPKCIIQSYLQWLQDSDYNPICELCSKDLIQEDCVRLTCYHVFHWSCLDQYSRQLPSTTAPAGYTCPACRTGLFPANNLVSPVADVLRQKLAAVNWARAGLGLPLLTEDREIKPAIPKAISNGVELKPNGPPYSVVHVEDTPYSRDSVDSYQTPASRRVFQDVRENRPSLLDHDDDKYKRRPASEWVRRWWKNSLPNSGQRRPTSIYKKYCMLGIIIFISIIMIIVVMDKFGRRLAEDDPMLDFRQNDQIRVQDPLAQRSM